MRPSAITRRSDQLSSLQVGQHLGRSLLDATPGRRPSAGGPGRPGGRGGASSPWSGIGFGASSPVSKAKLSSIRALTAGRPSVSPFSHRSNISWWSSPVQCVATPISADGADGQQRQRHRRRRRCRPRSRPAPRRSAAAVSPGLPAASFSATMLRHLAGQPQQQRRWRSCDRCGSGCRRPSPGRSVAAAIGPDVGLDAGLRRAVVVRADGEDAGGAELRRPPRSGATEWRGVVGAGAGDDRDRDRLDDRGEQRQPLVVGQRRRLARRAGDDEPVVAVLLQLAGQRGGGVEIERPSSSNGVTIAVSTRPNRAIRNDPSMSPGQITEALVAEGGALRNTWRT